MTLIVGVHRGDHLLLSADSGMYDSDDDSVTEAPKLECGGALAWGFSGYVPLGEEFHQWMRAENARLARLESLADLLTEVENVSARINGQRWQELQAIGVTREQLQMDHFAHVIVAGYIRGRGMLIKVQHGRPSQIVSSPGPLMSLGVDDMAEKAHAAMQNDGAWTPDEAGLQRLMDLAITFGHDEWNLRQPVRMLKVTETDSQDVTHERFWKRFPGLRPPSRFA